MYCYCQSYENYSFEELRFAAPVVPRPSENMLVRANSDGTYSANWTPGSVGWYKIQVMLDGYETGKCTFTIGRYQPCFNLKKCETGRYTVCVLVHKSRKVDMYMQISSTGPYQGRFLFVFQQQRC